MDFDENSTIYVNESLTIQTLSYLKRLSFIGHPMEKYCAKKHEQDLKLVSAIFYQFFIFLPSDSPSKTVKNVFYLI